ncbi:hypothetical protein COY95_01570, partial [Candidatus Woesearchaeota archaeon CG_4_10_14_0_8_um_filter_47_5]
MKNLLIVTENFYPKCDGVTRFLDETVPFLSQEFNITMVVPDYGVPLPEPLKGVQRVIGFPVFRGIGATGYHPCFPQWGVLKKEIARSSVVFAQMGPSLAAWSIILAGRQKKKTAVYFHIMGWDQIAYILTRHRFVQKMIRAVVLGYAKAVFRSVDMLLVPSEDIVDEINQVGIATPKRVVHPGVNTSLFRPPEDRKTTKRKMGIPEDKIVIGFCGRLSHEKDIETLLRAFEELEKKYPNLFLLLVGDGEHLIKEKAQRTKNARVTGFVSDVVSYYQAMDIYVSPSLTETTGLAIVEAMACGLPIISTPVGFARTSINNSQNGLVF